MLRPSPSDDLGVLPDEILVVCGQAHRDDVLLEDHVLGQPHQGHVVAEVGRVVAVVNLGGGENIGFQ